MDDEILDEILPLVDHQSRDCDVIETVNGRPAGQDDANALEVESVKSHLNLDGLTSASRRRGLRTACRSRPSTRQATKIACIRGPGGTFPPSHDCLSHPFGNSSGSRT